MIETHPFKPFVPQGAKYLILGTFAAKQSLKGKKYTDENYDFYYGVKRNQFWPILEKVYGRNLKDTQSRLDLLSELHIAMADIIYQCERKSGSNLDSNLINIVYAKESISQVFEKNQISKVFFTSRKAETKFRSNFKEVIAKRPNIELVTLPSPSTRYARMLFEDKIKKYKELLPPINSG